MICGDCLAQEGEIHEEGCDQEKCLKCGKQKLQCYCGYNIKREPHFSSVYCCQRCGEIMSEMKMISDEEWKFICGVTYSLDCILCINCMEFIKEKRGENDRNR